MTRISFLPIFVYYLKPLKSLEEMATATYNKAGKQIKFVVSKKVYCKILKQEGLVTVKVCDSELSAVRVLKSLNKKMEIGAIHSYVID